MTDRERRRIEPLTDEAIDRAVREMMHVDAPADMRARVLLRLEQRPRTLVSPRLVAAAALAAIVLLAFVMMRGPAPAPATVEIVERAPAPRVLPVPAGPAPPVTARVGDGDPALLHSAGDRDTGRKDTSLPQARFTGTITIPPLDRIDPIVIAPLQPSPVPQEEIVIPRLAPLAELEIEPLFPSDGRS